jgi:DNA-binding response OmpR family regulator
MTTQKILCVHDAKQELRKLQGALEEAGYKVVPAKTGSEAMRILQSENVNGVVLDFRLDAPGGLTLRNSIRHAFPEIPLLLFSHVDEIKQMPLSVFEAYLHKPGPLEALMARVSSN